jgi:hypothetical protein
MLRINDAFDEIVSLICCCSPRARLPLAAPCQGDELLQVTYTTAQQAAKGYQLPQVGFSVLPHDQLSWDSQPGRERELGYMKPEKETGYL